MNSAVAFVMTNSSARDGGGIKEPRFSRLARDGKIAVRKTAEIVEGALDGAAGPGAGAADPDPDAVSLIPNPPTSSAEGTPQQQNQRPQGGGKGSTGRPTHAGKSYRPAEL